MSVPKIRHVAFGLAAAGLVGTGLLATVGHDLRGTAPLQAEEPTQGTPPSAKQDGAGVRVDAPGTVVNVDKDRGKVHVTAPHTEVNVDPDKGRVQVRAPYVNLDIRW